MATFYTNGETYAVNTKEGLVVITKAMYECLIRQYEIMGWIKDPCGGITNFFQKKA